MWGAATHDRATGIHRPLSADAIIFQPLDQSASTSFDESGQILIAVDHCLLWNREMQTLLDAVSQHAQVKRGKASGGLFSFPLGRD